ncbi:Nop14-like protein [Dacryopinax primogenitus]|uniref:Nop14-like protein n=1 Tax=Dacryopinax primogenitus (strain DJM 731) TaxID=1858805 RepID=M5GBZ9_DACPD|nr:Nop14-like protein [Dacryopinax primogenitus]EJU06534.1 Nop14-like protein [Dacryopinax primogenitus]
MGKGSQLSQLKAALQNSGLARKSQSKRGEKRKRDSASEGKDGQRRQDKLDKIVQDLNPFEVKVTRLKHDVGGRKLKGVTGRPGLTKQVGIETRKKTLLPELDTRNKAGSFVDRRFGENDPGMAPEDRMLERFTRERQQASKGALFNLDDDVELTHYGQSLSMMDDFDDTGMKLSDEEGEDDHGRIDAEIVSRGHFGGFADDDEDPDAPPRKKNKAEVMAEVIAKSKEHKHLRHLERERDDALRQTLDDEFGDIRGLLFSNQYAIPSGDRDTLPNRASSGSNSIPIGKRTAIPIVQGGAEDGDHIPVQDEESKSDDDYDKFVRELAFDKRSKPTNRLKTEEEIAEEEKEKLETAERARLRRMRGEEDDGSDEEGHKKAKRRVAQADDLDDGLDLGENSLGLDYGLGEGLGQEDEHDSESEEDEDEDEDEDDEEQSEEDESAFESDLEGNDSPEDLGVGETKEQAELSARPAKKTNPIKSTSKELPFIFPCPETHEEFLEIVDGLDGSQIPVVVHRIRVRYHPSLGVDYKEKLHAFLPVLLDHVLYASSPPTPSYRLVAGLFPHIKALATTYPVIAAEAFISKLTLMQKNLSRGLARGPTSPEAKTWPGPAELALLRLIGILWSTSDLEHGVVTPTFLLMGQYLAQCRVRSLADMASGLFLCTLCLQYTELSKRLVPEAVNFLNNALLYLCAHDLHTSLLPGSFPSPDLNSDIVNAMRLTPNQFYGVKPKRPNLLAALSGEIEDDVQTKVDLVGMAMTLVLQVAVNLTALEGFIELFEPTLDILEKLNQDKYSEGLKKLHSQSVDGLTRMLKVSRQTRHPLHLQAHKPIPIATYIPKFDEGHRWSKRHDPDAERNAAAKLRAQYKEERRGAMRELRKDNRFLASEKAKRQMEKDRAYNERMRKVEGSITEERHEEKLYEKEKMKQKRRAGKK